MKRLAIAALILFAGSLVAESPAGTPVQTTGTAAAARPSPVGVGDVAPEFALSDHKGGTVTLSAHRDARATVLVFFRGYW